MKTRLICISICLIFLFSSFSIAIDNKVSIDDPLEGGWLEERDGIKILHVSGSNYEMGYQHGYLLKEEAKQNLRAFLDIAWVSFEELLEIWYEMEEYCPQEYIDEMQGIADGGGVTFEEVVAGYMVLVLGDMGCFGISAWGPATADGKLYHTRSFDQPVDIQDPETGIFAHENHILIVRNPDDGYASLIPSIAGGLHGGGGINSEGIAIGQQVCWSKDQTLHGISGIFRTQMVLDYASTAQEAIDILTNERTLGWNYVVSDSKIPIGYAIETTASHYYVGTYDNPTESIIPFWQIDHAVRRTNFFIYPTIAETQRNTYNPSGLLNLIKLVQRKDVFFAIWQSYKIMSMEIEKHWGSMDLESTMNMMKKGYCGNTNFLLYLIFKLAEGTSFNRSWNLWVACPETGDMIVSFADRDQVAQFTAQHYYNLFELLEENPP